VVDALLCDPAPGTIVLADKADCGNAIRDLIESQDLIEGQDLIESQGAVPNIPSKPTGAGKADYPARYKGRNAVERMFCRLKDYRRIATRYDKLAANFLGAIYLAAAVT